MFRYNLKFRNDKILHISSKFSLKVCYKSLQMRQGSLKNLQNMRQSSCKTHEFTPHEIMLFWHCFFRFTSRPNICSFFVRTCSFCPANIHTIKKRPLIADARLNNHLKDNSRFRISIDILVACLALTVYGISVVEVLLHL